MQYGDVVAPDGSGFQGSKPVVTEGPRIKFYSLTLGYESTQGW